MSCHDSDWLDGKFDVINQTDNFAMIVSDHDDTLEDCNERCERLWAELAADQPSPLHLPEN